jgi:hypothetical protein
MNSLKAEILVIVIEQVLVPEPTGISTCTKVLPVVMVVGYVQVTRVNIAELVIVANERCFVVVMKVVP